MRSRKKKSILLIIYVNVFQVKQEPQEGKEKRETLQNSLKILSTRKETLSELSDLTSDVIPTLCTAKFIGLSLELSVLHDIVVKLLCMNVFQNVPMDLFVYIQCFYIL